MSRLAPYGMIAAMNVALIHNRFSLKGGSEAYLYNLVQGFVAQGDTVTFITYRHDPDLPIPPGCKLQLINLKHTLKFRRIHVFRQKVAQHLAETNYDLSLSATRTSGQDILICGITHAASTPTIRPRLRHKDRLEIRAEQIACDNSHIILAHSNKLKHELRQYYQTPERKIKVIYPPINPEIFNLAKKQQRAAYQQQYQLSHHKFKLFFPASGHKRLKGWDLLWQAWQQLPEDQFELITTIKPNHHEAKASNIKYIEHTDKIAEFYVAADCTILPSRYDGFGLVISESIQCGTPVIVSPYAGCAELITNKEGIVLPILTPAAIASTIQTMRLAPPIINHNFAQQHGLTINEHINQIKQLLS